MGKNKKVHFGKIETLLTRYASKEGKETRLKEFVNDYVLPRMEEKAKESPCKAVIWAITSVVIFYPDVLLNVMKDSIKSRVKTVKDEYEE